MIYQELTIAPHLTVEANVMLGQERIRRGLVRRRRASPDRRRGAASCSTIPTSGPRRSRGTLSVGAQQLVEVARALVSDARVIVFDEPTSSLTERDADAAVRGDRAAAGAGAGDRLHQPFPRRSPPGRPAVHGAPRRPDGRPGPMAGTTLSTIIAQMVGRDLTELFPQRARTSRASRSSS